VRIVFDITTSLHWKGPAVGIVRVEQGIAQAFFEKAELRDQLVFVSYDKNDKKFQEIQKDQAIKHTRLCQAVISQNSVNKSLDEVDLRNWLTIKERLQKLLNGIELIWDAFFQWEKKPIKKSLITRLWTQLRKGSFFQKLKKRQQSALPSYKDNNSFQFSNEDIYLSFGLDWEDKDLDCLLQLKKEHSITTFLCSYDIIPYICPQHVSPESYDEILAYIKRLLKTSDHLMTISCHSKKDLEKFCNKEGIMPPHAIHPIHIAYQSFGDASQATFKELAFSRKETFLLTVGSIDSRKNIDLLYRIWQKLEEDNYPDIPHLVIVGRVGWDAEMLVKSMRTHPRLKQKIHILDNIDDNCLAWLYENCYFFLYPTYYEGFGLPLAEVMLHGKFALASDTSSLPEVSKGLAEHLDPRDFYAWYKNICFYLENPDVLAEKERHIQNNFKERIWDDVVTEIINIIKPNPVIP